MNNILQLRQFQLCNVILIAHLYSELRKRRRVRTVGVREIFRRRRQFGDGHNLIEELRFGSNSEYFFIYTRMNVER